MGFVVVVVDPVSMTLRFSDNVANYLCWTGSAVPISFSFPVFT